LKLEVLRDGHLQEFQYGNNVFQTTTNKLAICSAAVRFSND